MLNGIVGRFDVERGRTTDDGVSPRDEKEYFMPTKQLGFSKKIKSKSSNDKLEEELHSRLDSEHALLRAIAKDGLVQLITLSATRRML